MQRSGRLIFHFADFHEIIQGKPVPGQKSAGTLFFLAPTPLQGHKKSAPGKPERFRCGKRDSNSHGREATGV